MTALQKISQEAKRIYKANPNLSWKECIKKASLLYSKKKKNAIVKSVKSLPSKAKKVAVKKVKSGIKNLAKKVYDSKLLSGIKKPIAKKSPARSLHKDTKSHNVNIRVMSGVKHKNLPPVKTKTIVLMQSDYNDALYKLERWTALLNDYKMDYKLEKDPIWKKFYKNEINKISKVVSELKIHLKHIK